MITNANYVFGNGNAIRVEHPRGADSWFWRDDSGKYIWQRQKVTRNSVDRDDIERIANHDENEYELVPVEDSPFGEAA